jgi:peptidyl-prolyl cis-trans isomerase B (cyclophilin B)
MKYTEYLNSENPQIKMEIENIGDITLELFPSVAPITVENFLTLVDSSFYDGLIFHRVIKGFMIQGGDPQGNGMGGSKNNIKGEFKQNGVDNPLEHTRGVISMARAYNPNSASSQFFIMHKDASYLDGAYAAFGTVIDGIEIVDKIANVRTSPNDRPLEKVTIKSIRRIR